MSKTPIRPRAAAPATVLALSLIFGMALARPLAAVPGEARARLEGGPFLPYRINAATLKDPSGLIGEMRLEGRSWDGSRLPLFEGRNAASSSSAELHFYLDEDIRSLVLTAADASGQVSIELDLSAEENRQGALGPAELAERDRMRALSIPPRLAAPISPEGGSLVLEASDILAAARLASSRFFAPQRPPIAITVLAISALGLALASLLRRGGPRLRGAGIGLGIALALAGAIVAAAMAAPGPWLFRAAFPPAAQGSQVSGVLERRLELRPGYTLVSFAPGEAESSPAPLQKWPALLFIGFSTSGAAGIPLAELGPEGSLMRLSPAPMVSSRGGSMTLRSGSFTTGWIVNEGD